MKCGLMPLCYEAMAVGEIAYTDYTGGGPDDAANIRQALSSNAKVCCLCQYSLLRRHYLITNFSTADEMHSLLGLDSLCNPTYVSCSLRQVLNKVKCLLSVLVLYLRIKIKYFSN